jgi:release factor glutamine methyltransferase
VKEYEPKTALEAGPTGTELIERLLPQALPRLFPGGALLVEISPMIVDRVVRLFEHQGGFEEIRVVKDLSQRPRVVMARRRS